MTQRIESFFKILLKELNPFQNMTRRIEHFSMELFQYDPNFLYFPNMIWRVEPTFLNDLQIWLFWKNESNIWTLFEHDSKNWSFFHLIQIIEPYFKIGSKNWIFKAILSIEFFENKKNTEKIERIDWTLLGYHSKDWTFLLKIWLKELFFLLNLTQRIVPFLFMIQILGPFSHDSKNWTFFFYVTQILDFFFENFWFKEMDPFFFRTQSFFTKKKITHRIELFVNPTHRIDIFFVNTIHRIDPFFNTTHRIEHFLNTTHRIEHFLNTTHRNKDFSWIWRKELNRLISWIWRKDEPFNFLNMTQRIEPFFKIWLEELNIFQ